MGNDTTSPGLASPGDEIPPFRLRLAHYLLFVVVCSAVAAIQRFWAEGRAASDADDSLGQLYSGFTTLLFGAAFTALVVFLRRRWRFGRSELKHPGHWLLAFIAAAALIQGAVELALEVSGPYSGHPHMTYYTWSLRKLLLCSLVGVTCLVFTWLMPANVWWKAILATAGATMLALVPQHVLVLFGVFRPWYGVSHIYACIFVSAATLPLMAFACRSDSHRLIQRDWLHWIGVFALAATAVVEGGYALYWLSWA